MQIRTSPSPRQEIRSRTARQAAILRKRNHHDVLAPERRERPRGDLRWRRATARGRPELESGPLVDAAVWLNVRSGLPWDEHDDRLKSELVARSWGFHELVARATDYLPTWTELVPGLDAGRLSQGCIRFVACVISAHKSGAIGVLASYPELGTLFHVDPRTVARWVKDKLEPLGILEVIQTWQAVPGGDGKRGYWKLFYRPGPALRDAVGHGLLEGARELAPQAQQLARWHARRARRTVRRRQHEARDAAWRARDARRRGVVVTDPGHKSRADGAPVEATSLKPGQTTYPVPPTGDGVSTPLRPVALARPAAPGEELPQAVAATFDAAPDGNAPELSEPTHRGEPDPAQAKKRSKPRANDPSGVEAELAALMARLRANAAAELEEKRKRAAAVRHGTQLELGQPPQLELGQELEHRETVATVAPVPPETNETPNETPADCLDCRNPPKLEHVVWACRGCEGSGRMFDDPCRYCGGTGEYHREPPKPPDEPGAACSACRGSGDLGPYACAKCIGTGRVQPRRRGR